jgi:ABC-type transport system involved in multi-copper enzyme maturation permease subunit
MMWLTWRQFRAQAVAAGVALVLFAIMLAVTASRMNNLYASSGITGCHGAGACAAHANQFLILLTSGQGVPILPTGAAEYVIVYFLSVLAILLAPAIIGIFWGAPLIARELESGSCRLAWNQSVTRTRWLAVKLGLIGAVAMAVTEAFSLLQAWWAAPIGRAVGLGGSASILTEGRFGWFVFPTHGITPLGYAAFAFVLGVTAGMVIRRAIPAMAVTLAIFAAAQAITPLWIRPNLIPHDHTTTTVAAAQASIHNFGSGPVFSAGNVPGHPDAWIMSSTGVTTAGQPVTAFTAACMRDLAATLHQDGGGAIPENGMKCLDSHGIRVAVSYIPTSMYWPLQLAETGLYLALALALAWYCYWRLNRRLV